jgi:inositol-pentakisphosphate 2-kinase
MLIPAQLLPLALTAGAALFLTLIVRLFLRRAMTTTMLTTTTSSDDDDAAPVFPADVELTYLAEGAANIIYRLSSPRGIFSSQLLRLRKTLPSAQPNKAAYAYLAHTAFRLFPGSLLVSTELIRIPREVLERENERLLEREERGARPKKRCGLYLEKNEQYAFLVADMSARSPREVMVEFKPKWVVQSPSAPAGARRCRNCALRLKKSGERHGFCPLDLASGDVERVRRAVGYILPKEAPKGFEIRKGTWELEKRELEEKVVQYLAKSELMPTLAALQKRLDPEGPLRSSMGKEFLDAMTVRDLTVFLRVDMDGGVECGVGDLDMKSKENGKEAYWRETERALIENGFYEADMGWECQL